MERFSGFDGDDDESGGNGDFTFNVDGTNNDADHRPSTPRSKHSAMEQRRRSKINERFQVLRELIPHSDQKRDKASLLLEVIEHIRTLHEKVQKYESSYPGPGWIEENAKSMPWGEVYFRSCWKNAQNNSPCPGDGIVDPSQDVQNGSLSPGFVLLRNDNSTPISVPSVAQNLIENDINAGVSYKAAENTSGFAREVATSSVPHPNLYASVSMIDGVSQSQQLISDADNMASLSDTPWLRSPFLPDCPLIDDTLNGHELGIDEGTISVSCAYSNGLLTTLSRTLQSSGIDLSQASISVDINLGKRSTSRRPSVTTTMSTAKDPKDPSSGQQQVVGHSRVGSSGEDTEEAYKKHKSDNIQC